MNFFNSYVFQDINLRSRRVQPAPGRGRGRGRGRGGGRGRGRGQMRGQGNEPRIQHANVSKIKLSSPLALLILSFIAYLTRTFQFVS